MKALLLASLIAATAAAVWAVVALFRGATRKAPEEQPWEKSLDALMQAKGQPRPTVTVLATHTIALSLANLSRQMEKFNESTERVGKSNLILGVIIALATVAYAVASWLQLHVR